MAKPRMRSAKKEIVDREELHRILDEAMVMRLGMLDGARPYVVPLNFLATQPRTSVRRPPG